MSKKKEKNKYLVPILLIALFLLNPNDGDIPPDDEPPPDEVPPPDDDPPPNQDPREIPLSSPISIACLGDSITYPNNGYCNELHNLYGSEISNAYKYGYSGRTSKELVDNCYSQGNPGCTDTMLQDSSHQSYSYVILLIGTNDLYINHDNDGQTTLTEFNQNLRWIVNRLRSAGNEVLISTIPPCNSPQWQCAHDYLDTHYQDNVIERNRVIRRVSDDLNVPYADIFDIVFGGFYNADDFLDRVHPNYLAHSRMADEYIRSIRSSEPYDCSDNPVTCY